jgi:alcohol dehydrogenase (cytochrome c)
MTGGGWSRRALVVLAAATLFAVVATFAVSGLRWRVRVAGLKAAGHLPDLGWGELAHMLRPGSHYYLAPLIQNPNPYLSIANPFTTPADSAQGEAAFRARCSTCHAVTGGGRAGPDLGHGLLVHGASDWALYRSIQRGVPGTAMAPQPLPERAIWSVVAYLRSVRAAAADAAAGPGAATLPFAAITAEHLTRAGEDPGEWLTFGGTYDGRRFSRLAQITPRSVHGLQLQWLFQLQTTEQVESTPLVANGMMFLTTPPNNVRALDARDGHAVWIYRRTLPEKLALCCGRVNRGVALLGERVYFGTLDAHLVALDARTGAVAWDVPVADPAQGYSITGAPLAVGDKVIVGVAGGEYGIRGFLDAYDAASGRRVWRFYTIPGPGEPGHETWSGESWRTGGAPTWTTGTYDADLNLLYWPVGNPAPNFNGRRRPGDNLYSNSVVALDADRGTLRWYFQFTPHDEHDWDANEVPVLIDGPGRKLLVMANRNGFLYVLDRERGTFLGARPFARQTWALGLDSSGKPIPDPRAAPSRHGTLVYPSVTGATNWWPPAYSPATGLLYVPSLEKAGIFFSSEAEYSRGEPFTGSAGQPVPDRAHQTMVQALEMPGGALRWSFRLPPRTGWSVMGGLLATAGGVVFGGDSTRFFALDAATGRELWRRNIGGVIVAAPITYLVDGHQRVTIAAGRDVLTYGLESSAR